MNAGVAGLVRVPSDAACSLGGGGQKGVRSGVGGGQEGVRRGSGGGQKGLARLSGALAFPLTPTGHPQTPP
eukprot:794060-Prorocentrum_minimum.AAC.1